MRTLLALALFLTLCTALVSAQDPADGWLAYAYTSCPRNTRVTHIEAKWKVGQNPRESQSFFSPWMGMDTTDNLNLLQPVNPWFGSSWSLYTEYFQWEPEYNQNSISRPTQAGHVLHGSITYNGDQTYTLLQRDMNTGIFSTMRIAVQRDADGKYKNYTIPYIVYEKVADCNEYPPDEIVTFYDIMIYCNGERFYPKWSTGVVEDVCDFEAHSNSPDVVNITWDTHSRNRPTPDQIAQSQSSRNTALFQLPKKLKGRN